MQSIKELTKLKQDVSDSCFSKPWKNSDAVFIVQKKELHVHTTVLGMASEVFGRMFSSGFKESRTKEVELKDKKFEDIELLLKMIYPQLQKNILGISQLVMFFPVIVSKKYWL